MSQLTLTVDHRVADGRLASDFLRISGGDPRRRRVAVGTDRETHYDTTLFNCSDRTGPLPSGRTRMGEQRCFHDFRLRVETAAKAGFTAMGFWHADISEIRKKYSFREMKQILDDNGITHIEVEWLLDWFCTGERRAVSDADPRAAARCRRSARRTSHQDRRSRQRLRGGSADDGGIWPAVPPGRGARHERAVRNASRRRSRVRPRSIRCWRSAAASGAKNGGIMLDNLHLQRTAHAARGHRPQDRARHSAGRRDQRRHACHAGKSPGFRRSTNACCRATASSTSRHSCTRSGRRATTGPIGVEVLNEYIRKWPLETAATEAFAKTTRVVTAAREKWEAAQAARR